MLLSQTLGFLDLHPSITEPGPYQDENFQVPIPLGGGEYSNHFTLRGTLA